MGLLDDGRPLNQGKSHFMEIVENIDVNTVQWIVTYYRDNEKSNHKAVLSRIGVPEKAMVFCKMTEL